MLSLNHLGLVDRGGRRREGAPRNAGPVRRPRRQRNRAQDSRGAQPQRAADRPASAAGPGGRGGSRPRDHRRPGREGLRRFRGVSPRRDPRPVLRRICGDQPFHPDGRPHPGAGRDHALAAAHRAAGRTCDASGANSPPSRGDSIFWPCCGGSSGKIRRSRASATPANLADEFVTIWQNPYFEFPDFEHRSGERRADGPRPSQARFLGMFGPQGALPLTTTEEAYGWLRERDDAFPRFVDVFQRRFLALFFRAWADAHPVAQNDRPDEDRFRRLYRLDDRDRDAGLPRRRLDLGLRQAAICRIARAARSRAPRACASFSRACLRRASRSTSSSAPGSRWIRASARGSGAAKAASAQDCVAGASMYSVSDKFRIRVYVRDIEHFEQFLPGSPLAERDRRRCVSLRRRGIRLGHGACDSGGRDHAGSPRAGRSARLDELDGAELVEDGRDDPHGRAIPCRQPPRHRASGVEARIRTGETWAQTSASNRLPANSTASATRLSFRPCGRPKPPATATSSSAIGSSISCRRTEPTSR